MADALKDVLRLDPAVAAARKTVQPKTPVAPTSPTTKTVAPEETSATLAPKVQELFAKKQEAEGKLTQLQAEENKKFLEGKAKVSEEYAQKGREATTKAEGELKSYDAFHPSQETQTGLAAMFALTNLAAFMSGGSGRYSGMAALGNMTNAMKGYQAGRKDVFDREMKEYEKNVAALKLNNEKVLGGLKRYMELLPKDKEAAMDALMSARAQAGDGITAMKMRLGDYKGAYENEQKRLEARIKLEQEVAKLKATAEQHRQTLAQRERLAKESQAHTERMANIQAQKAVELAKFAQTGKNIKTELPIIQGIRSIEHLQTQLRDPDVQLGLKAKAAPLLEKVFSLGDKTEFEQAVNSTLTGTDKTTVFLKDALLATYEIERAAKNNQRLTVQDMKMVGPVLDPTNYTPEAYNQILEDRRRVLYNNAQDIGMTQQDIKSRSAQHPYEPFGLSAPTPVAAPSSGSGLTQAEKDELAALKAKHGRQ
jgi:hypothetical protein